MIKIDDEYYGVHSEEYEVVGNELILVITYKIPIHDFDGVTVDYDFKELRYKIGVRQ